MLPIIVVGDLYLEDWSNTLFLLEVKVDVHSLNFREHTASLWGEVGEKSAEKRINSKINVK